MRLAGILLGALVVAACGRETRPGDARDGGAGRAGNAGNDGNGASGGGPSGGGERGDSGRMDGGDAGDPGTEPPNPCDGRALTALRPFADVYLMLDRSDAMREPTESGESRFEAVADALARFAADPASSDLGLGVQYFPLPPGSDGNPSCESGAYALPAVAIQGLPELGPELEASLVAETPAGVRPLGPALAGAIAHGKSHSAQNAGRRTVVVLATHAVAEACEPVTRSGLAMLAGEGSSGAPAISTFVIGLGGPIEGEPADVLNAIAEAGGTAPPLFVPAEGDVSGAFLEALAAIRGAVLPCTFEIPRPSADRPIDFEQVTVFVADEAGENTVARVDATECGADGGWHYDRELGPGDVPNAIVLCPASCDNFRRRASGSLRIEGGCTPATE